MVGEELRGLLQDVQRVLVPLHAQQHPAQVAGDRGVGELVQRIRHFTDHYNPDAQPFMWTATADSILGKIQRLCRAISGTRY